MRSAGAWTRRTRIEAALGVELVRWRGWGAPRGDAIAGWGDAPISAWARRQAQRHGLACLAFADGFLHAVDDRRCGGPLSLVCDTAGTYDDAETQSSLEALIESGAGATGEMPDRGRAGLSLMRALRLAGDNDAPELAPAALGLDAARRRVLVLDQPAGDAAIAGALAGRADFAAMLDAAIEENAGAEILVRLHPDVAAGRRRSSLADLAAARSGVRVIDTKVNPWSLFDMVERVYTVSSQTGMEALIAGLPVSCFGVPFYAGWGLTDDRRRAPRRTRRVSLEELFAAAYLRHARYVDPYRERPCSFEEAAEIIAFLRTHHLENGIPAVCVGVSRWKRRTVARFLDGAGGPPLFRRRPSAAARAAARRGGRVITWATRAPPGLDDACAAARVPLLRMEDGFLRSVGLGAALNPAASLCLDETGIYYDPRSACDLETLIETTHFGPDLLARARRLRETVVRHGMSKYNLPAVPGWSPPEVPCGQARIFVPGQVEDDASVRLGAPEVGGNLALLAAVRARHPDGFILYKPHPDVVAGYRDGLPVVAEIARLADHVVTDAPIARLLDSCDRVETMTSLAGFEALLRGRPVTVHGRPFYAGWGLTEDLLPIPRRSRRIDLDMLVAAALLLYPRYADPVTGLTCPAELIVDRLAAPVHPSAAARLRPLAMAVHAVARWRRFRNAQRRLAARRPIFSSAGKPAPRL